MLRYVIYRVLYGEDFIQESIQSIEPYVDKIFIFWTNKVLGHATEVNYKNQTIKFPAKFDNVVEKVQKLKLDKAILIEDYVIDNIGQTSHLINDLILPNYKKPDTIIFMEHDHVFHENQVEPAIDFFEASERLSFGTKQIELWKTPEYCIPERQRSNVVFWNTRHIDRIPQTLRGGEIINTQFMPYHVHNFGFCMSKRNMYWKHLTALAFSRIIGDSLPNENWYEDKWLNWDFHNNNKNLEIAKGYEQLIPYALVYNIEELPLLIRKKFNL